MVNVNSFFVKIFYIRVKKKPYREIPCTAQESWRFSYDFAQDYRVFSRSTPYRSPPNPAACLKAAQQTFIYECLLKNFHSKAPLKAFSRSAGCLFPSQYINCMNKLVQILKMPVHRGKTYIRHLVEDAQLLKDQVADDLTVNFPAAFA